MEDYTKIDKIILEDMRKTLDLKNPKKLELYRKLEQRLSENNSLPRQHYLS